MNPFLIMEQHKDKFTQNDLRIYQAILENPAAGNLSVHQQAGGEPRCLPAGTDTIYQRAGVCKIQGLPL